MIVVKSVILIAVEVLNKIGEIYRQSDMIGHMKSTSINGGNNFFNQGSR